MNKNTEVLIVEYNTVSKFFDEIIEVKNIGYAPYILKSFYTESDFNNNPFKTNLREEESFL